MYYGNNYNISQLRYVRVTGDDDDDDDDDDDYCYYYFFFTRVTVCDSLNRPA